MITESQYFRKFQNKTRKNIKDKLKSPALVGAPMKSGVVERLMIKKPKKPNSAQRKVTKVMLCTKRRIDCYIQGIGHNLQKFSHVIIRGGRAKDLPGVRYHCVKGLLDFSTREKFQRKNRRSLYGIKKPRAE